MSNIIPFKNPKHRDVDALSTAIFTTLSTCKGIDAREVIGTFRKQFPELRTVDFLAGCAFAKKILNVFERLTVEMDHAGDGDAG